MHYTLGIMEEGKKFNFGSKALCIARRSTFLQSDTAQESDLRHYVEKNLNLKVSKVIHTTESGFLEYDKKEGWNLVEDFFNNNPDCKIIVCTEISRLSRRQEILHRIKRFLIDNKIQLIIKDISFRLFDDTGEIISGNDIIFSVFGSLAEAEMRQKRERFKRSLIDYKKEGYCLGGKRLFGYTRTYELKNGKKRSRYEVFEDEAKYIRDIYRWYAFGIDGDVQRTTILKITEKCIEEGFPKYLHSKRNVNKCLKEQAYFGTKETHNKVKNPDYWNYKKEGSPKYIPALSYTCSYPPIFTGEDQALRELVDDRLKKNNSKLTPTEEGILVDKSTKHITLLSRLVRCPFCHTYLHGDYRKTFLNKGTEFEKVRWSASYRCSNSRGTINKCDFHHSNSMPLLDSVVWAYVKPVVLFLHSKESRQDYKNKIDELRNNVENLTQSIADYDINKRIEMEAVIFRSKASILKGKGFEKARSDYNKRVTEIKKELKKKELRKLELEREIDILTKQMTSTLKSVNLNDITDKKYIYDHIHRIIDHVEMVGWSKTDTVIKVYYKDWLHTHTFKNNEYIFFKSLPMKRIEAYIVYALDPEKEDKMREITGDNLRLLPEIEQLAHSDKLKWNNEEQKFTLNDFSFNMNGCFSEEEKMFVSKWLSNGDLLQMHGIRIKELKAERLNCYGDDMM